MGWTTNAAACALLVLAGCGGTVETATENLGNGGSGASASGGGGSGGFAGGPGTAPQCTLAGPEQFAGAEAPWGIEGDADSVFWVDENDAGECTLRSRAKVGGPVAALAVYDARPWDLAAGDGFLYVAEPQTGLTRVPKQGGAPETLAVEPGSVVSVALDATHVYYADGTTGTLKRVPPQGGEPELLAEGLNNPGNVALDEDSVYWIDEAQHEGTPSVLRMSKSGGAPVTLAAGDLVGLKDHGRSTHNGLAAASGVVVWVDEDDGAVYQVPKQGGAVTTLASGLLRPTAVRLVDGVAYVAVDGENYDGRAIVKIAASGGALKFVVKDNAFVPYDLVVDDLHVYWTNPYSTGPVMKACR